MRYQEILEACWKGYRQAGMKDKGGRQVPNCVPVEEVKSGPEITGKDLLFKAAAMAIQDASHEGVTLDYEQAIRKASRIYGIPYTPSELPRLLAQRAEIDRQLALLKQGKQVARARRQEKQAPTPAGAEEYWKTHALPTDRIKPATKSLEERLEEDLKKWFKEKWVRFGPDGKIRGDCARGSSSEGKPKCLPQSKAQALGKKGRASAAAKKRREDPNPERRGAAKNVATRVNEFAPGPEREDDDIPDQILTLANRWWNAGDKQPQITNVLRSLGWSIAQVESEDDAVQLMHNDGTTYFISADDFDPDVFEQTLDKKQNTDQWELRIVDQWEDDDPESYGKMDEYAFDVLHNGQSVGRARANNYFANLYVDLDNGKSIELTHQKHENHPLMKEYERLVWGLDEGQDLDEKQDACYSKVKSRYKVWPSAYASGALVQCRKKGAANWGNKSKK